jgi:hypothetical protein
MLKFLLLTLLVFVTPTIKAQIEIKIQGYVKEQKTGEPIPGANVIIPSLQAGAASDRKGYYSFTIEDKGTYTIKVSAIGYQEIKQNITVIGPINKDFLLQETYTELDEIVITDQPDANIKSTDIGKNSLDIESISSIPPFLGEVDVVKSILMLPGVTNVAEGSGGFNVRGGSIDQNLVLLDQAPLFNSSHVFGFFSVFNPDVVDKIDLYKGGIPARYGGRISSVLSVTQKNPDLNQFKVNGGVGLVSSRAKLEIPLIKGKTSLLLGGRTTYSDWLLRQVPDEDIKNSTANFYDVNGKLIHFFDENNQLKISGYLGKDNFKFAQDTAYSWQNRLLSINYRSRFSPQLWLDAYLINSNYQYNVDGLKAFSEFNVEAAINYNEAKSNVTWEPDQQQKFDFGFNFIDYTIQPGILQPVGDSSAINPRSVKREYAQEAGLYGQYDIELTPALSLSAGIRFSSFWNRGPGSVFTFAENSEKTTASINDTLRFNDGEVAASYGGLEPRFSARLSLNSSSSLKFSYNRLRQYVHLISNTLAITPTDIWKTSDYHLKPLIGDQWSAGYFKNFNDNQIETSVEVYYKQMKNMVEFKDGAELLLNQNLATELLQGRGKAYGLELLLKKKSGKLTGWLSYTFSRTLRLMEGDFANETINQGNYYPSNFDKPHEISLVGDWQMHPKWNFGFNYTYSTGRPITIPIAQFTVNEVIIPYYSERNAFRVPDYHRLDLSFTFTPNLDQSRLWQDSWTFSLFNVYGRQNPYSIFFRQDFRNIPPKAYQISVIGAIFPSLTYNFSWR